MARQAELARASRAATVVALAIVLSRLAGLVRQRVVAYFFGTSALADVIAAAFRIGNLAQNLLGEGTLSATFIPVYAKLRAEGKEAEARAFARDGLGALGLSVMVLTALGVLLAPWLALLVAGGFRGEKLVFTVELTRWLFPMTGLLVLSAWALGVLNAHRRFFLPYAAPVLWSAAQIAAVIAAARWLGWRGDRLARALAFGAIAGAALMLALLSARARFFVGSLRPTLDVASADLRAAVGRFPAAVVGRGVIQLSGLIDTLLVSFLGDSAVSSFNYAQIIYLLPMSVLGAGEAAAMLPEMAGDSAEADAARRNEAIRRRLCDSLTRIAVLAVPAVVAMSLVPEALTALLFRTGKFDRDSTARVAAALRIYGLALLGNASVRLFATAFFALGDTKRPARMATLRVLASTAIALALMKPLGVVGVVTGAAGAAWVEALWLGRAIGRELGGLDLARLPLGRLGALALLCGGPAFAAARWLGARAAEPLMACGVLALCGAAFLVAAPALGLLDLRALVRRR